MSLQSLSLSLVMSSGPIMQPQRLELALRLSGLIMRDETRAGGTVARRERGFVDVDLSDAQFREVCRAADEAGFAERAPRVQATVDTSDCSRNVVMHIAQERGSWLLELGLMASGFEGADAAALHRFFAVLLECAGVEDESLRRDLADMP